MNGGPTGARPDTEPLGTEPLGTVLLGTDRTDITPARPVPLAGYAARDGLGPATRILAPLRLRTLAFGADASAGGGRAVLLVADLLWWGTDVADQVRAELSRRYGLEPDAVFLHATHNHSGPQLSERFVPLLGEPDTAYLDQVSAAASAGVGRALASMSRVTVERSTARARLGVDRRSARTAGSLPPSAVDDEATVVRFRAGATARAFLVHFACHPVVHHGNAVTSDFAGAATDRLEAAHPGSVAAYLQGCCGDVNPDLYRPDGVFCDGGQAEVDRFGARLSDAIEQALDRTPRASTGSAEALHSKGLAGRALAWRGRTVRLPVARVPSAGELREQVNEPGVLGQWARLLLDDPQRLEPTVPVRLSLLRIAEGLTLLGMSGEPVGSYGRQVKAESAGAVLPLGYTNGMTGYLVTARQLTEGGYEVDEAPYYFGLPSPPAPAAEGVLRAALRTAIRGGASA